MRLLLPQEGPGSGGRLGRSLSFHSLIKAQREGGTGGRESAPGGGGGTETGPPAGGEANPNSLQQQQGCCPVCPGRLGVFTR